MDFKQKYKPNSLISYTFLQCSWCIYLLLLLYSPFLTSQNPIVQQDDIDVFATILKSQGTLSPLDVPDLSMKKITIYWLYQDRRSANVFHDRINSYLGGQDTKLEYRWNWPKEVSNQNEDINIFIYGDDLSFPSRFNALKNRFTIVIAKNESERAHEISLPNAEPELLDLTAQFIMNGLILDEQGDIITGERFSFLPPEYFGLDQNYISHKLDSILEMGLDSAAYPGAEVCIAYKGSVIYHKIVGHHTYDRQYSVRSQDLFDLASLTKVTAGINTLMSLYELDKFSLDKTLGEYFPYFQNSDKENLDMKRILTHSAGLMPYMVYYTMAMKENGNYSRNTISSTYHGDYGFRITDSIFISNKFNRFIYKAIKDSPLTPGHEYKYSGLFFLLIPDLIKEKTGQAMDRFLTNNLFQPLGAHNTSFNPLYNFSIHQIVPTEYDKVWRKNLVHGQVHDEAAAVLGGVSGNAGLFSTGIDLIKIGETWRRKGTYGGKRYWSEETMETFTRCYYCDEGNRRALGFDRPPLPDQPANSYMSPLASQHSYGHSGFTGTMIWVDPTHDYTFVFLSNRVNPTRNNSKIYSLNIRPALHSVLYEALNKRN